MKIKFTLQRSGAPAVDLVAAVDAATTVGELAAHLVRADPGTAPGEAPAGLTLGIVNADQRALDPGVKVGDSGLRSGSVVALARSGRTFADPQATPAAIVRITGGPDQGREFGLARGSNVIGRDRACEIRLTDPLVSRQHARLNITDFAEIVDLGSANGIQVGASSVPRSVLRSGDTVRLGDTDLAVRVLPGATGTQSTAVEFVRSPRLDPRYTGVELVAPEPPQRVRPQRFPIIPLLAPLVMGVVLYLVTRSVLSLVFIALSPLLIVGNAVESTLAARSSFRRAVRQFRSDLDELVERAERANATEVTTRGAEHPPLADCLDAVRTTSPLLWTRRPADPGFAEIRLGAGRQPARNSVSLPDSRRLPRDLVAELEAATERFAVVDDVPVIARPAEHGAIGLAGPRPALLDAARALLGQIAALHSPAEAVIAGFAANQTARDWDWLKWLPHTTSVHSPIPTRQLAANATEAVALVSELEDLVTRRGQGDAKDLPVVFVLVEDDAPVERSRLVELAEHGREHGVHVLWLAPETARLPSACRHFVSLQHGTGTGTVGFVHTSDEVAPVRVDGLDAQTAVELARRLSPVVDSGARIDDDSDLPRTVSLLAVPETPFTATAAAVLEQWTENRSLVTGPLAPPPRPGKKPDKRPRTLRAVVGKSTAGVFALDLRSDGPHALIGGTTGAGKSELLQAWILALALAHSPQRLTFLLVDYKGGAAFKEFESLPHNVGMVTDLGPHLVRRALVSLDAELKHRERLFHQHNVKDLVELEKKAPHEAPPSLVIVVDEFAALVNDLPEFVDGVVNVAQRGRSLGVHLILATQRPAGVIKENLRANTNLRIALRTADETDSSDVLGSAQAAFIDPALPGRAVAKTGPGRLTPFQAGYAGGWTTEAPPASLILVEELRFGAGPAWEVESQEDASATPGPPDITRLVQAIGVATGQAGIALPRRPWLPVLRKVYDLSKPDQVPATRRDDELVFGIQDDPVDQRQPVVAFRPDVDGNLAVYGTGGSGKSTLLRTLAIAAGFTVRGGPCHVYGLDFGARGLAMLEDLPHVGSIVAGADHERVARLLSWLRTLIDDRALRYSRQNAGTVGEYRASAGAPTEPRVLLLLDGVAAFRQAYEVGDRSRWFDLLVGVANDGRPVGVHVLLSADRPAAVPSALASAIQTRVALRMADTNDYATLGVPTDVLSASSPPGRGLLRDAEIQVAMLGRQPDVGSQAANIRRFAAARVKADTSVAPAIQRLGHRIALDDLPKEVDSMPVLGMSSDELAAHPFEPRGTFLVCGPPRSGRTTTVHCVAAALRRWDSTLPLHYLGNRRSVLATLDLWTSIGCGPVEVAERAEALPAELDSHAAVFLENVADFANGPADSALQRLIRHCLAHDLLLVAEGETSTLSSGSQGLVALTKSSRVGVALAPDSNDGAVLRTTFPSRLNRADFPPGRALFVSGGKNILIQVALP